MKPQRSAIASRFTAHDGDAPILVVSHLTVRFDGRLALDDVSFLLASGDRVAVVGPNGAGKSTLFRVVAGVLAASSGSVAVAGREPGSHICIAYVPQRTAVDWTFPVSVFDVVMMGRAGRLGILRGPGKRDREKVRNCLEEVGIGPLADRQIGELSGGQQQRMFIARALAQEAELVLMDEPLVGLDLPAQEGILHVLDQLRHRGVTVMLATHDLNLASAQFGAVVLLNSRLIGFGSPAEVFTPERLQSAYGGNLRMVQAGDELLIVSDTCCGEHL